MLDFEVSAFEVLPILKVRNPTSGGIPVDRSFSDFTSYNKTYYTKLGLQMVH